MTLNRLCHKFFSLVYKTNLYCFVAIVLFCLNLCNKQPFQPEERLLELKLRLR